MRVERDWETPSAPAQSVPPHAVKRNLRPVDRELSTLAERLEDASATIAVVGMGYVGLPLLVAAGTAGFTTIGIESDAQRLLSLRGGRSYVEDVSDEDLRDAGAEFGQDEGSLAEADVVVMCVPTPLTNHVPDLSYVEGASELVGRALRPGMLVILESTTYPGTTEEVVRPILEYASGLEAGRDFALAYSPERIDPGQNSHHLTNTPKIVSGLTDGCRDLAALFYGRVVDNVVLTKSPREAEMAKLIENVFRQVNIALVNELAIAAAELDVDVWEAIRVASSKPFGYMPFWPGPGVGGHCIAIDPSYLSWQVREKSGLEMGFIEHANEINRSMPRYVFGRVRAMMNAAGKQLKDCRVMVIGASYKPGVGDQRESPAVEVIGRFARLAKSVCYHDPYVPALMVGLRRLHSQELNGENLGDVDVVVILTAHKEIDYRDLIRRAPAIFDAQGVTLGIDAPNVVRL